MSGLGEYGVGRPTSSAAWLAANADLDRLDGELLAAHVLNVGRAGILAHPETELTAAQWRRLDGLARRRREGEPTAYLLGQKEFYGLNFYVNDAVLVPRPETELLVELALRRTPRGGRVVDLGTGSGCIAVALKAHRPDLRVTATDISSAALAVASANADAHDTAIAFVRGDWLTPLRGPFDCIVANPPYIAQGDPVLAHLGHEPRHALTAGADGLEAIDQIAKAAPRRMAAGCCLIVEHGCDQVGAVRDALAQRGLRQIQAHIDLGGLSRATVAWAQG